MEFISTRDSDTLTSLDTAIVNGLAPDGGLYVPKALPAFDMENFKSLTSLPDFASKFLKPFFTSSKLTDDLADICEQAFNFPIPLTQLDENNDLLELFHGPTLSFKDVGARFLNQCLSRLTEHTTLLVATSGDTGSAVASAFSGTKNISVCILFPKGKISQRQQAQMTCWDNNVLPLAVEGVFDDCQRLVKAAFHDESFKPFHLSTANSINIARLLPQMVYYAFHALTFFQTHGEPLGFIVPSGNLGNICAALLAKQCGFPIRELVLATNANRTVSDYIESGEFTPRATIATLANAMDVGSPSNFERLAFYLPTLEAFKEEFKVFTVSDTEIEKTIVDFFKTYNTFICPHTATSAFVRHKLSSLPYAMVATAHPAKFETVLEPILGQTIPLPESLKIMIDKAKLPREISATLSALNQKMSQFFLNP